MDQYKRKPGIIMIMLNSNYYHNIIYWQTAWKTINHFLQNPQDITDNELAELFRIGIDMYIKHNPVIQRKRNYEEEDVKHRLFLFQENYLPVAKEIFVIAEAMVAPIVQAEIIKK